MQQQLQAHQLSQLQGLALPMTPLPLGLSQPALPAVTTSSGLFSLSSLLASQAQLAKEEKASRDGVDKPPRGRWRQVRLDGVPRSALLFSRDLNLHTFASLLPSFPQQRSALILQLRSIIVSLAELWFSGLPTCTSLQHAVLTFSRSVSIATRCSRGGETQAAYTPTHQCMPAENTHSWWKIFSFV
ncbi:Amino-terminal enhancer of split [Oryzias melastigma]|uniref:Amino-terminal enhancer of split n=1 Tax=Oryzias melastigma TaxID=30732 RepID=A0A834CGW1_ORYME|nr:Amino-terminal enhancer of split [Oryzias melastigma]